MRDEWSCYYHFWETKCAVSFDMHSFMLMTNDFDEILRKNIGYVFHNL